MQKDIFIITTVSDFDDIDVRCVGYFFSFNEARLSVINNSMDIAENGSYKYCVIERMPEGLYPETINNYKQFWFQFQDGKYVDIDDPQEAKRTVAWGMG